MTGGDKPGRGRRPSGCLIALAVMLAVPVIAFLVVAQVTKGKMAGALDELALLYEQGSGCNIAEVQVDHAIIPPEFVAEFIATCEEHGPASNWESGIEAYRANSGNAIWYRFLHLEVTRNGETVVERWGFFNGNVFQMTGADGNAKVEY